jgi:hypothetical protein
MEQGRVECNPADVKAYFQRLADRLDGTPASFVYNPDEPDFQDWADQRERRVVVPSVYAEIPIPIEDQNGSRCLCVLPPTGPTLSRC